MAHVAASSSSSSSNQSQSQAINTQGRPGSENHHLSQQNDDVKLSAAAASLGKDDPVDDYAASNTTAAAPAPAVDDIGSSFKPEGVYVSQIDTAAFLIECSVTVASGFLTMVSVFVQ